MAAFAPELKPKRWRWQEAAVTLFALSAAVALLILASPEAPAGFVFGIMMMILALAAWASGRERMGEYKRKLNETPGVLFDKVASKFRREIEVHRNKVLGPDSEWQRARSPILYGREEANRSIAYWRRRLEENKTNEAASAQLLTAEELETKFSEALKELDYRSEALLQFFNECEARLPVLEHFRTDHEESLALAKLKARAEGTVTDAEEALALIGRQFVSEALRMGQALGALERYELKESAASVPLDRIEHVADQILSSSQEERETLAVLMEKMER